MFILKRRQQNQKFPSFQMFRFAAGGVGGAANKNDRKFLGFVRASGASAPKARHKALPRTPRVRLSSEIPRARRVRQLFRSK